MNIPIDAPRPMRLAAVLGAVMALCMLVIASCASCQAGTADAQVRSALDAFNLAASPAWAGVNEACVYRQRAINAEAQAGRITVEEAWRQIGPVRARCHALTDLFRAMRVAHDQASTLVEQGKVADAEAWLDKLRDQWREAGELAPPDAGTALVADAGGDL